MITADSFAADTHQGITSEQSLIGTELDDGEENGSDWKT